ncbi:MAG: hypothetical protein ACOWWR_16150 [Eubacteriales bacterium]
MKKKISLIFLILVSFLTILYYPLIKSMFIMYFYSMMEENHSIMEKRDFKISIPGGFSTPEKDWYPFVMIFNDDQFSKMVDKDIKLTILYNFGTFNGKHSSFYQKDSDYYSAFYGAYVIENSNLKEIYGITDGNINEEEIKSLAKYDLSTLVLDSMGCPYKDIDFHIIQIHKDVQYLSYTDWIRVDTVVQSRSPLHEYKKDYSAYIQYGKPPAHFEGEDFEKINLLGRMYCRYFEEIQCTVLLYIIAPEGKIVDDTDKEILSKIDIE